MLAYPWLGAERFLRLAAPGRRVRPLLWLLVLGLALGLGQRAPAATIAYDISSSGVMDQFPFSGLFEHTRSGDDDDRDDDDRDGEDRDDDGHDGEDRDDDARHHDDAADGGGGKKQGVALSDDLAGLIVLSTEGPELFLEGQELVVDQFSLAGTGRPCPGCEGAALSIELDPELDSVLVLEDGALEGVIHLLLSFDGDSEKSFEASVRTETVDPEWNFATPELLSLMLAFELAGREADDDREHGGDDRHEADDDRDDDDDGRKRARHWKKHARDWKERAWKREHGWDDDDRDRDDWDDDDRDHDDRERGRELWLKAQGPVVPEPDTALLVGGGLLALALGLRRRRRTRGSA